MIVTTRRFLVATVLLMITLVIPIVYGANVTKPSYLNLKDKPFLDQTNGIMELVKNFGIPSIGVKNDLPSSWTAVLSTATSKITSITPLGGGNVLACSGLEDPIAIWLGTSYGITGWRQIATMSADIGVGILTSIRKLISLGGSRVLAFNDRLGIVMETRDSGYTWTTHSATCTSPLLMDAIYIGSGTLLTVGGPMEVSRSTDYGNTWSTSAVTSTQSTTHLYDLELSGNNILYMVGNKSLFKSTDLGVTWTELTIDQSVASYTALSMVVSSGNSNNIVVIGSGHPANPIYVSQDGGVSWSATLTTVPALTAIDYCGMGIFTAVGYGFSTWSNDSGATWVSTPLPGNADAYSVCSTGYGNILAGTNGSILKNLNNTGSSGSGPVPPGPAEFQHIVTLEAPLVITCLEQMTPTLGFMGTSDGKLYRTTDGWQTYNAETDIPFTDVVFTAIASDCLAGDSSGRLWVSSDHGDSWSEGQQLDGPCVDVMVTGNDGNFNYLALSPHSVYYSSDLITWVPKVASITKTLYGLAKGGTYGERVLAFGENIYYPATGTQYSTDYGVTWNNAYYGTHSDLYAQSNSTDEPLVSIASSRFYKANSNISSFNNLYIQGPTGATAVDNYGESLYVYSVTNVTTLAPDIYIGAIDNVYPYSRIKVELPQDTAVAGDIINRLSYANSATAILAGTSNKLFFRP